MIWTFETARQQEERLASDVEYKKYATVLFIRMQSGYDTPVSEVLADVRVDGLCVTKQQSDNTGRTIATAGGGPPRSREGATKRCSLQNVVSGCDHAAASMKNRLLCIYL